MTKKLGNDTHTFWHIKYFTKTEKRDASLCNSAFAPSKSRTENLIAISSFPCWWWFRQLFWKQFLTQSQCRQQSKIHASLNHQKKKNMGKCNNLFSVFSFLSLSQMLLHTVLVFLIRTYCADEWEFGAFRSILWVQSLFFTFCQNSFVEIQQSTENRDALL